MKNIKKLLLTSAVGILGLSSAGLNVVSAQLDTTHANVEFTNTDGVLELIETPETFTFGTQIVKSGEVVTETLVGGLDLTLSDLRPTATGWTLNVSLTPFSLADNPSIVTLKNATLTFSELVPNQINSAIDSEAPTINPIVLASTSTEQVFASANRETGNQGEGPWGITGDVALNVPALQSSVGSHTATVNWSLVDGY